MKVPFLVASVFVTLAAAIVAAAQFSPPAETNAAITKGVAYLRVEVPKWKNNGDATRALLVAGSRGFDVGTSLDDTLTFLREPSKWDQNKMRDGLVDKALAHVQFASALAVANRVDKAPDAALQAAAKLLLADQKADGSWTLESGQTLGSPVTYGATIATWAARATLIESGKQPDDFVVVQADKWLLGLTPENVLDASAIILGLGQTSNVMADALRAKCLSLVREGQAPSGGWGPYVAAPPQVFDTALAVLALATLDIEPRLARATYRPDELKDAIAKGRAYLVSQQKTDGSWPETTRPAGQDSYAHRISTTGWALLALLGQ